MRLHSLVVAFALSAVSLAACNVDATGEDVDSDSDSAALVQFPADVFAGAPQLAYGATSAPINYSRAAKWGVVRFNGTAGDNIVAKVSPTTADRLARAYLVERRDGKYLAILSGTNSVDGLVKAQLDATQEYFIVFRDYSRRNATFTVGLERAGSLPASCAGTPLLEQGIVDRTLQAQLPSISAKGEFESSIRRCNVATGCAAPVKQTVPQAAYTMTKRADAKWVLTTSGITALHDGTTGELKGTLPVRADDGRTITVNLTGAATTGCLSLSGRDRAEIDAITYYDVDVTFRAITPPVAERVAYPAVPPAADCEGQAVIPDEELLARFAPGAATAALGTAYVMEDQQYCHPQTGCRPWTRVANVGRLTATAKVVSRDQLGMTFTNNVTNATSATFLVDDGIIKVTSDVLGRNGAANTSSISDTHLFVKETNVFTLAESKYRRFVCIPIPAHP